LFLLAGGLAWYALRVWRSAKQAVRQGEASLAWPKTPGRVTASQAVCESTGDSEMPAFFIPWVVYEYVVGETRYASTSIAVRDMRGSRKSAEAIAARYLVGQHVDVTYDPQSPQTSLLEPGSAGVGTMFFGAVVSMFVSLLIAAAGVVIPLFELHN
jgi:hypothetical protein